jgi:hypothetical protein
MNSLAGILRQNEIDQTRKSQARARAMNSTEAHPKKLVLKTVPCGQGRTMTVAVKE